MSPIESNLQQIRLARDAAIAGLPLERRQNVTLVAVSKTQPGAALREAFRAGQRDFGENYVQEGIAKIAELADLHASGEPRIVWHFIGPLQSNKAKLVAQHFDWVHGVDRLKIAQALSRAREDGAASHAGRVFAPNGQPLNICVQVNVSGEASKGGIMPDDIMSFSQQVAVLPGLKLRGLMAIIENTPDTANQRAQFRHMQQYQLQLKNAGLPVDTLSMGMSQDFKVAIEEGATMIRIGSAIFGQRDVESAGAKH